MSLEVERNLEKEKKLKELGAKMNPSSDNDIESFLKILSSVEKEEYTNLIIDSDKEKFYDKIIRNRNSKLRTKMNGLSVDKYIASDPGDITAGNVREYLGFRSAESLEKELSVGLKEMQRHYTSKAMTVFVNKRNKIDPLTGELDRYITMPETTAIRGLVMEQLTKDPTYKMTSLFINNTSGSITLFNDKMIESKRDLEIYKELYCNEKGMTPESFDKWQEYVKLSIKDECIDGESGFSNLVKFDKAWHMEALQKFFKKVPGFVFGETEVYKSDLLIEIDNYDAEKNKGTKNPITKAILLSLDEGIARGFDLDAKPVERVHNTVPNTNSGVVTSVKNKRMLLKARQAALNKPKVVTGNANDTIDPSSDVVLTDKPSSSLFDMTNIKTEKLDTDTPNKIEDVVISDTLIHGTDCIDETPSDERTVMDNHIMRHDLSKPIADETYKKLENIKLAKNDIVTLTDEEILAEWKKTHNPDGTPFTAMVVDELSLEDAVDYCEEQIETPEEVSTYVETTHPDPSEMLFGFRNKEIEDKVIVHYDRKPDTSLLRQSTISDPKARMQMYKNSAVVNGFRIYLPYSGYEVIVKKIQDKSRISYLFSLLQDSRDDLSVIIEQEVFKIIYDCLEFPDVEYVTYVEFTKSLSEGDIPILMVALAMTNIKENSEGRVILPVTSLKCTNSECDIKNIPVEPINVDLYDLFSKIYPLDKYVEDYKSKLKNFDTIQKAFRSGNSGRIIKLQVNDADDLCKFTILMSKPTIYKNYSVKNQDMEVNFDLVKEDIMDRPDFYAEKIGFDGLDEYIKPLSFSLFGEKSASVTGKVAMLQKGMDEFTVEEIEEIREEINDDMAPITMINSLLSTNIQSIQDVLKVCRFIDAIKITTTDDEPVDIATIENHDSLTDMVRVLSSAPISLFNEVFKKIKEVEDDFEFEHENVYYTSDNLKGRMSKDFVANFARSSDDRYRAYIREQAPEITDVQVEQQINYRKDEFEYVSEGKCACGNDTFYINYISIIFFSIFNKSGVVKG